MLDTFKAAEFISLEIETCQKIHDMRAFVYEAVVKIIKEPDMQQELETTVMDILDRIHSFDGMKALKCGDEVKEHAHMKALLEKGFGVMKEHRALSTIGTGSTPLELAPVLSKIQTAKNMYSDVQCVSDTPGEIHCAHHIDKIKQAFQDTFGPHDSTDPHTDDVDAATAALEKEPARGPGDDDDVDDDDDRRRR